MSDSKEETVALGKAASGARPAGASAPTPTDDETPALTLNASGEPVLTRGTVLKRYVVVDPLGQGGMAMVYTAYDTELHRRVALKLLRHRLAVGDQAGRARLLREAQTMAQLSHPNVVAIYDVGSVGDQVFMAMELVDGGDLKRWLRERKRGWRETLELFIAAGRGLSAAHRAGLIHRDFKPANVLVGTDGRVRVTDFGLARGQHDVASDTLPPAVSLPAEDNPSNPSGPRLIDVTLTQAGAAIGTPAYMAPEQEEAQHVDARTDQYSFCVSLYEALHGELPSADVVPTSSATVPEWIDRALARGLRSDPDARFSSMDELLAVLAVDPARNRRRRRVVAAASALAVVTLAGGLFALRQFERRQSLMCRGAERKLAGVWDAERRHAIEQRFAAGGKATAAATFAAVAGALDKYARDWVSMSSESCEATRIRGEQSEEVMTLRMVCLDNRLEETRALTDLFTDADQRVIDKSIDAVAALGDLRRCADVETLRSPVAAPKDEAQARAVKQLRAQLARAKARLDAGKAADALPLATGAVEGAGRIAYAPLAAEAYLQLGHVEDNLGKSQDAYEAYFSGLCEALRGRAFDGALASVTGLLFNATLVGKLDEGMRWAREADGIMALVAGNAKLKANLLSTRGTLEEVSNHLVDAERDYRAAVDVFDKQHEPERLAALLNNLGSVLQNQGRYREALATYQRSLDTIIKDKGPDHPLVAAKRANLSGALADVGRFAQALVEVDRALEIQRKAGLTASYQHGLILAARAQILLKLQRVDDARRDAEAGLAISEATMGKSSPYVAQQLTELAAIARTQKRPDVALQLLARARAIDEQLHDDDGLAAALDGLALVHVERGARTLARPLAERALAVRATPPHRAEDLAEAQFVMARSLGSSPTERARAIDLALQAREAYRHSEADRAEEVRRIDAWLANAQPADAALAAAMK